MRCHSSDTGKQHWNIADAHRGGVTALVMSNNQRFAVWGWKRGQLCLELTLCVLCVVPPGHGWCCGRGKGMGA